MEEYNSIMNRENENLQEEEEEIEEERVAPIIELRLPQPPPESSQKKPESLKLNLNNQTIPEIEEESSDSSEEKKGLDDDYLMFNCFHDDQTPVSKYELQKATLDTKKELSDEEQDAPLITQQTSLHMKLNDINQGRSLMQDVLNEFEEEEKMKKNKDRKKNLSKVDEIESSFSFKDVQGSNNNLGSDNKLLSNEDSSLEKRERRKKSFNLDLEKSKEKVLEENSRTRGNLSSRDKPNDENIFTFRTKSPEKNQSNFFYNFNLIPNYLKFNRKRGEKN